MGFNSAFKGLKKLDPLLRCYEEIAAQRGHDYIYALKQHRRWKAISVSEIF